MQVNSKASYDIETENGIRIQVKSRVSEKGKSSSFSTFRNLDTSQNFDIAIFLVFDPVDYDLWLAKELSFDEVNAIASKQSHVNGFNVTIS